MKDELSAENRALLESAGLLDPPAVKQAAPNAITLMSKADKRGHLTGLRLLGENWIAEVENDDGTARGEGEADSAGVAMAMALAEFTRAGGTTTEELTQTELPDAY